MSHSAQEPSWLGGVSRQAGIFGLDAEEDVNERGNSR
jgi:hypothetical protein